MHGLVAYWPSQTRPFSHIVLEHRMSIDIHDTRLNGSLLFSRHFRIPPTQGEKNILDPRIGLYVDMLA